MEPFPENGRTSEGYIARNHLEGEKRARRALCLLRERDRRIAQLEQRVVELEDAASTLHLVALRASSGSSGANISKKDTAISGKSTSLYGTSPCRSTTRTSIDPSDREMACVMLGDNDRETNITSKIDDSLQGISQSILNDKISKNTRNYNQMFQNDTMKFTEEKEVSAQRFYAPDFAEYKEHPKSMESTEQTKSDTIKNPNPTVTESAKLFGAESPNRLTNRSSSLCKLVDENNPLKTRVTSRATLRGKRRRSSFTLKVSCSLPWIRGYRSRYRGISRIGATAVRHSGRDSHSSSASTGADEQEEEDDDADREQVDVSLNIKEAEVPEPVEDSGSPKQAQEARPIAEMKSCSTQTSMFVPELVTNYSSQESTVNLMETCRTETLSDDKKSLSFWSINDEPASAEVCRDLSSVKEGGASSNRIHYERIVYELETRLDRTMAELEEALKAKISAEQDCKRALERAREEAQRENECLQEKIVRVCSSILEKFGPYAQQLKRKPDRSKSTRLMKYYERSSKKWKKRLRIMKATLRKVRKELQAAEETIREKTNNYESLKNYFNRLKQQTELSSANLNNIIAENGTLREKIENMKEWLELQVPEDKAHKYVKVQCRLAQKRSEIVSLRKQSEEDFITITQLRNKLLHMESSDANKEFLLNSYKGQLTELYKERQKFLKKIDVLENEIRIIRNIHHEVNE